MTQIRFGKAPARRDPRNFPLMAMLRAVTLPSSWDIDAKTPGCPLRMYGNDWYGDCVIAARANQTMRFEKAEQGRWLNITDKEVTDEYFRETGGPDVGLVYLDSLSRWRKAGWVVGGKTYKIQSYAEATGPYRDQQVKALVYANAGAQVGIEVPQSAVEQFDAGRAWTVVSGPKARNLLGGHAIYVVGYNPTGPICHTWARRQQMT